MTSLGGRIPGGVVALVALSACLSHGDEKDLAAAMQESIRQADVQVFAGLPFIKQGRVGTRSAGPDYFLQTSRGEYLLGS